MPTESFSSFSGELINDALFACQSGVFEWQVAQQKMIVSSGLATLLGFPAGAFDGSADSFLNRLESADRERIQQKIAHLDLDITEIEFEFRVSGSRPHWFNARGKIIRAADGQLASIIGLARELASETITARKMRIQQDALLRLLTRDKIDTLPAQEAFTRITKRASRTLNLDRVSIWMYGNDSQQLDNLYCTTARNKATPRCRRCKSQIIRITLARYRGVVRWRLPLHQPTRARTNSMPVISLRSASRPCWKRRSAVADKP